MTAPRAATSDTAELLGRRERAVTRGVANNNTVFVVRGSGARVWDVEGREYVDFAAGIGTLNVGHSHPRVVSAIREQAERFSHTCFTVAMYEEYVRLAERLAAIAPGPSPKKVLLANSGAEAVENAIRIARIATGRSAVIAFTGAFHGRTLLGMTLTGKEQPYKTQLGQLAPDVYRATFPDPYRPPVGVRAESVCEHALDSVERVFDTQVSSRKVAAIIVEPVLGESGFVVPPAGFLSALRSICDRHGILLVADEIQTGFGRTGRMFAVEHEGVEPDLLVVAKSLAAGLPLSGVIGKADVMDAVEPGTVGGTYGGNPVACAAALAVLDVFEEEPLLERSIAIGARLKEALGQLRDRVDLVGDVRGIGAMVAFELVRDRALRDPAVAETAAAHDRCFAGGLLLAKAGLYANVIRLLPPLVATDADVECGIEIIEEAFV
ncbi:MAG: 4-aminobutyrate--2-oxoglutarate transaminase [Candidatus Limnocylindria bacterium]